MAYLGLRPMIMAWRTSPADFEMDRDWLRHFPSRHSFKFDREGNVTLLARCDCAFLSIRREDSQELRAVFEEWHANHWRPIEINREFASHFRRVGFARRLLRRLMARI